MSQNPSHENASHSGVNGQEISGRLAPGHEWAAPSACPVCAATLSITRLECSTCGTGLTGQFAFPTRASGTVLVGASSLGRLSLDQAHVVQAFLASWGNLGEAGRRLGVDADTARSRVEEVLGVLELDAASQSEAHGRPDGSGAAGVGSGGSIPLTEAEILARVERGDLDPLEAARLIQTLG